MKHKLTRKNEEASFLKIGKTSSEYQSLFIVEHEHYYCIRPMMDREIQPYQNTLLYMLENKKGRKGKKMRSTINPLFKDETVRLI